MMRPTISVAVLLACLLAAASAVSAQPADKSVDVQHFGGGGFYNGGGISTSTKFVAQLRGSGTSASAQLTLSVDVTAKTASYVLTINNVPKYIMSHIHLGGLGVNGPVVVLLLPGLNVNASNVIANLTDLPTIAPIDICSLTYSDTITVSDLIQFGGANFTFDLFLSNLRTGTLYGNIHTVDAPMGLIRGQLLPVRGYMKGFATTCAARGYGYYKP